MGRLPRVEYRRITEPMPHEVAAFSLLKSDASGFKAFDAIRMASAISGMIRHTAKLTASNAGWSESEINSFVLGHSESKDGLEHVRVGLERFAYLPLPSIEARGDGKSRVVGSVRRVLITTFAGENQSKILWARRSLSGQELIDEKNKEPVALLSLIPANEKIVQYYIRPAESWSTVTPVILPGYDDPAHYRKRLSQEIGADEQKQLLARLDHRIDCLIRKAIVQAGFSKSLADNAVIEWRKAGFWAGTESADRYRVPKHLNHFSRYHVRLRWRDENKRPLRVSGPICIGGGRFYGLGLFARFGDQLL
ncbi:MAG: type I-U CRISPR-associated protein Csb2 [Methanothrix sp.]